MFNPVRASIYLHDNMSHVVALTEIPLKSSRSKFYT